MVAQDILYINANGASSLSAWDTAIIASLTTAADGGSVTTIAYSAGNTAIVAAMSGKNTIVIGPGNSATSSENVSGTTLMSVVGTELRAFPGLIVSFSANRAVTTGFGIVSETTFGSSGTFSSSQNTGTTMDILDSPFSTASSGASVGTSAFDHILSANIAPVATRGTTTALAVNGLGIEVATRTSVSTSTSILVYPKGAARADTGSMTGARAYFAGGLNYASSNTTYKNIFTGVVTYFATAVTPAPVVTAGGYRTTRVSESVEIKSSNTGTGVTGLWTSSLAGGTFANASSANTTWTPPATITGSEQIVTLTRTCTNSGGSDTDIFTVRVRTAATALNPAGAVAPAGGALVGGGTALANITDSSNSTGVRASSLNDGGLVKLADMSAFILVEQCLAFYIDSGTSATVTARMVQWGSSVSENDVAAGTAGTTIGAAQTKNITLISGQVPFVWEMNFLIDADMRAAVTNPTRVGIRWYLTAAS